MCSNSENSRLRELQVAALKNFFLTPLILQLTGEIKIKLVARNRVGTMTLQLKVPNMACSACSEAIAKAVTAVDPSAKVDADLKTKLVKIDTQQSETAVKHAIAAAGYTVAE